MLAHVQEFIALLLHEVQLLRRVCALSHHDRAFRAFELDFHGGNIDRRIGTETFAKDVFVLQHHVSERFLQTIRQVLNGGSDGVVDCLRELLFILVKYFHVLVVDIIAVDERKIDRLLS